MRAAVACGGDDDSEPVATADAEASAEAGGEAGPNAGSDGAVLPGDDAGSRMPTFCTGIVLYASFDNSSVPELGAGVTREVGNVGAATGQFGSARSFSPDASPDGAAVFFDREDGGAVIYPQAEGSIAFWFRRRHAKPIESLVRPLLSAEPAITGGLVLGTKGGDLVLWRELGGSDGVVRLTQYAVTPFLRQAGFDHYAEAWRLAADGGNGPLAVLAVNGGVGEVFGDSGVDAAGYLAQTPDDAGNLAVPFRAQTTTQWPEYNGDIASLRLGGPRFTAPDGEFDDFAVWNRVLSFAEIAELYRRTESIGAACKLP